MIEFGLGLVYGSFMEWWVHKKLFHEYGKKKDSYFAFHLRDHHAKCLKNDFMHTNFSKRETLGLGFLALIHLPIYLISPMFYSSILLYAIAFFTMHNLGHRYPKWAKKYQSWHWKHHMINPNKNWNVVLPLADRIMKTDK